MHEKIEKIINEIQNSPTIASDSKPLIIEKINEWREEESAINEIAVRLENWWMEVEPIFAEMGLVQQMHMFSKYGYEKKWMKTSESEAEKMISDEMPEADTKGTLSYIMTEIKKGKTVTLGECKFKLND